MPPPRLLWQSQDTWSRSPPRSGRAPDQKARVLDLVSKAHPRFFIRMIVSGNFGIDRHIRHEHGRQHDARHDAGNEQLRDRLVDGPPYTIRVSDGESSTSVAAPASVQSPPRGISVCAAPGSTSCRPQGRADDPETQQTVQPNIFVDQSASSFASQGAAHGTCPPTARGTAPRPSR